MACGEREVGTLHTPAEVERERVAVDGCGMWWVDYPTHGRGHEEAPERINSTSKVNPTEVGLVVQIMQSLGGWDLTALFFFKCDCLTVRECTVLITTRPDPPLARSHITLASPFLSYTHTPSHSLSSHAHTRISSLSHTHAHTPHSRHSHGAPPLRQHSRRPDDRHGPHLLQSARRPLEGPSGCGC